MSFTYAIGDLHGRLDLLEASLARIEDHRLENGDVTGEKTTIVFLGDYIDRGPHSKKLIERLMEGASDMAQWIILKGNHEDMAVMAHVDPKNFWKFWTENGGLATAMNYDGQRMPEEHLRWCHNLPLHYDDEHRLYVHAGIEVGVPFEHQRDETLIWKRYARDTETPFDKYVVHGHCPHRDGPVILETRCNLDTGALWTGMQCIAVFDDDMAGKPIQMLLAQASRG